MDRFPQYIESSVKSKYSQNHPSRPNSGIEDVYSVSCIESNWIMDGLISRKPPCFKQAFKILSTSYLTYFHFTQAAFPVEHDVAELAGVSPLKPWIVFMEKLTHACLHDPDDLKTKHTSSLANVLRCMTKKNPPQIFEPQAFSFTAIQRYPNILKAEGNLADINFHIIVHRQFNLNVTVLYYYDKYTTQTLGYLTVSGKTYTGLLYPFTLMSSSNSVEITFPWFTHICIGIEYSIGQSFNVTNYHHMDANGMYFLWGYFRVTGFRIHVDKRARLALNTTFCSHCKLIVYDGPVAQLPIIMKNNGTGRSERVVASTFQVFVVLIEDIHQQETAITYAPIYINTAEYNLSKKDYVEISFDNRTHCRAYSLYARSCAFKFYTSTSKKIRFSLKYLQFTGKKNGGQSAAGMVIYNHFNGTVEKLVELNDNFEYYKSYDFEIIGTGNGMYLSIFEYLQFARIILKVSVSTKNCNTFLVGDNHISYSGYITPVPDKWNVFQINQSSQALLEYNECYTFQFIHIDPPEYTLKFIFHNVNPMLLTTQGIPLRTYALVGCVIIIGEEMHRNYFLENKKTSISGHSKKILSINSLEVDFCAPFHYNRIEFMTISCKIPCPYIIQDKYCHSSDLQPNVVWEGSFNFTCDICENVYIFCKQRPLYLQSQSLPRIRILSKVCKYAILRMGINEPSEFGMLFALNRSDILSAMPAFKHRSVIALRSTSCALEIPFSAMKRAPNFFPKKPVAKAFHWGGALYHSVHHHREVSWEAAASYCQEIGAYLLTIHSQAEYHFVEEKFLKSYDVVVLYVGVKRKVICL